jgi:hypothetical protein
MAPEWREMARIGVTYASIETSEAFLDRLLGEQKEIQGHHGVNFGTETFQARLVLRYEMHQERTQI